MDSERRSESKNGSRSAPPAPSVKIVSRITCLPAAPLPLLSSEDIPSSKGAVHKYCHQIKANQMDRENIKVTAASLIDSVYGGIFNVVIV